MLAVSWLYPGMDVQIDCPCLDCGEPIQVRLRDGEITGSSPDSIVAHSKLPFSGWRNDMPET